MRDLSHENVNSFLGLGQDSDGVMLVWSHCTKGSLYDILGNDDLKIDFNFAMSFAEDIAQVFVTDAFFVYSPWLVKFKLFKFHN